MGIKEEDFIKVAHVIGGAIQAIKTGTFETYKEEYLNSLKK